MRSATGLLFLLVLLSANQAGPSVTERLATHRNLGKAFYENPTTQKEAVEQFRLALSLSPQSARERLNYGLALLRAGKTAEGIAELERVQKQDPSIPHTWFNLGIQYKRQGEMDKARSQLEKMAALEPRESITLYNLGVLAKMDGRSQNAITYFEESAKWDSQLAATRFQLFNLYRQAGRAADAQIQLESFQKLKKDQEGAAIPEDIEWNRFAEVLDEVESSQPAEPAAKPRWQDVSFKLPDGVKITWLTRFGKGVIAMDGKQAWILTAGQPPKLLPGLAGAKSIATGDFDNDGVMDLCVVTETEAFLAKNFVRTGVAVKGRFNVALWIDYDHDYDLDLLLLGEDQRLLRNQGPEGFVDKSSGFPFVPNTVPVDAVAFRAVADSKGWDFAVLNANASISLYFDELGGRFSSRPGDMFSGTGRLIAEDLDGNGEMDLRAGNAAFFNRTSTTVPKFIAGKVDELFPNAIEVDGGLAYIDESGQPHVALNRTPANSLRVQLQGIKNLKLAAGSEVEVKYGRSYRKKIYNGEPVLFPVAQAAKVDVVRITWPNGLIQNEVNIPVTKPLVVKEAQRLSGSCPMIWTWNGNGFEYITDVLGVAPLGASSGDGEYFPVDHDEHIQIPARALKERDGKLDVRITEELSEVAYLDEIALLAVDHPMAEETFLADRFKGPPFPDFKIYGVDRKLPLQGAREDGQRDTAAELRTIDQVYPRAFKRNAAGVAELHTLELDLAPGSDWLVLNGWVDWADGSTFLGVAQESKDGLIFPRLELRQAGGSWKTVIEDMGLPAGKPKSITVELPHTVPRTGVTVRIVTNLSLYWDAIFTASSRPFAGTVTAIHPMSANTRYRGFSKAIIHPQRLQPERFLYFPTSPVSMWNQTPGMYTRYGDVQDLLQAADDRFLIMGSGDELQLQFDPRTLPQLPAGWTRSYVLKVDGWAKDRDANTAHSQTVKPLPFHRMSRYPYTAAERFPEDATHEGWQRNYNTRPALRTMRSLFGQR